MRLSILETNGQSFSMTESDSPGSGGSDDHAAKAVRRIRRWPVDVKRRIVEETFAPGSSVSIVARRHDVNTNLLFDWRQKYRQGELADRKPAARAALPGHELIRIGVIKPGGMDPLPACAKPELRFGEGRPVAGESWPSRSRWSRNVDKPTCSFSVGSELADFPCFGNFHRGQPSSRNSRLS